MIFSEKRMHEQLETIVRLCKVVGLDSDTKAIRETLNLYREKLYEYRSYDNGAEVAYMKASEFARNYKRKQK